MPRYGIASLSAQQMETLRRAEAEVGAVLIAYRPSSHGREGSGPSHVEDAPTALEAIVDDYRTYDPYLP